MDSEANVSGNSAEVAAKTIRKVVSGIGNRAARFYWNSEKPDALASHHNTSVPRLGNPLVATTIAAGVVGVSIIVIIILTIWIRSKMPPKGDTNLQKNHSVVSSFSTLYEMEIFEDSPTVEQADNTV